MELRAGRSLRAVMPDKRSRLSRLSPEAVRRIGLALLDALGAAHARGIVRRDLSPENVLLAGPAGAVTLLDSGAARLPVAYLAPEQLADAGDVDARADLWAVGVMLYELLAGELPYRAGNLGEMMSALMLSEPVPIQVHLPGVDPSVRAFFARALARERSRRFASAHDMARALAAATIETAVPPPQTMGGQPTTASGTLDPRRRGTREPSPSPWPAPSPALRRDLVVRPIPPRLRPARSPARRWQALSIAAVAGVAIVVGAFAIASGQGGRAAAVIVPDRRSERDAPSIEPAAIHAPACGLEGLDCARVCVPGRRETSAFDRPSRDRTACVCANSPACAWDRCRSPLAACGAAESGYRTDNCLP